MKKYVKASVRGADPVVFNAVTNLQNTSNSLVDEIIDLGDNFQYIQDTLMRYDANGDDGSQEFVDSINWITEQLSGLVNDIRKLKEFYVK